NTAKLPAGEFPPPPTPPVSFDFADTGRLFASVPNSTLLCSFAILSLKASEPLVDLGTAALRASMASGGRLLRPAVLAAARATVHRQFCAGEGAYEASFPVQRMWNEVGSMSSILDAEDSASCQRNLAGFLRAVDLAATLPPTTVTSACVKITVLAPISLLERVSDLLRREQKDPSFSLTWRTHSFPILRHSSPLLLTPREPEEPLSEDEEQELQSAPRRLSMICNRCVNVGFGSCRRGCKLICIVEISVQHYLCKRYCSATCAYG
ncbi:proline dehydrogenase 2, mitochondrial-like, partial [Curcuma longa]|uniref:proline dehydrogenase 2, mitochondrial-like n=1 Tax=Curcuma longa TaxID=136217 RepID=UPI003D9DEE5C